MDRKTQKQSLLSRTKRGDLKENIEEKERLRKEMKAMQEKALLNKLLPRIFKLKLIKIPETTPNEVVVEPNKSVLGYKTNCYKADLLEGIMKRQEFNHLVFKANKIIEEQVLEIKRKEHEDYFADSTSLLKVTIVLSIIGMLLMAVIVYGQFERPVEAILQYVAVGFICCACLCSVIVVVFIQKTKFVPSNFDQNVKTNLQELMKSETEKLASSGRPFLEWTVGEQFFWISLKIVREKMPPNFKKE